ncbi:MAG TPA: Tol-Pal system beta propeller repeat protein TolB [Burkholderiales bacterium]|nr:Tol-Pal system beta propeller repeat protein TolB [Burkholderiales bacterium]
MNFLLKPDPRSPDLSLRGSAQRRRVLKALALSAPVGAFGLSIPGKLAAQLTIEIIGGGADQIPITVVPFGAEEAQSNRLSEVIAADLARSGRFKLQAVGSVRPLPTEPGEVNYRFWKNQGNQTLVIGRLSERNDGKIDVRFRLMDTTKEAQLLGYSYTVGPAQIRATAHKIADQIYEKLTGEPGVFSTRIAYVARHPNRFELHVADADGFNSQFILAHREPVISPAWSPEGNRIAYVSFEQRKAIVFLHDLQKGTRTIVANYEGSNSAPAWAPDGERLAVVLSKDGVSQLYSVRPDGNDLVRLTNSNAIDTEPSFSPDGKTVLFTSDRGGSPQIYRMRTSGGAAERVTFEGNYNVTPRYSPDGKSFAFIQRAQGRYSLAIMDFASRQMQALTDGQFDGSPTFAPNGRLVLYASIVKGRGILAAVSSDGRIKQKITASAQDVREPAWGPLVGNR